MVLLSASVCGIRKLLFVCESYAKSHGLIYNVKKCQILVFSIVGKCKKELPKRLINNCILGRVDSFKGLGHYLNSDLKD